MEIRATNDGKFEGQIPFVNPVIWSTASAARTGREIAVGVFPATSNRILISVSKPDAHQRIRSGAHGSQVTDVIQISLEQAEDMVVALSYAILYNQERGGTPSE